jgi:hypothetical protein
LWVKIIPIFVDAGNSVAHVSLKDRHALMDISNGVVDGEMEAVMEVSGREMVSDRLPDNMIWYVVFVLIFVHSQFYTFIVFWHQVIRKVFCTEDLNVYRANQVEFKTWMAEILMMTYLRIALVALRMVRLVEWAAYGGWLCMQYHVFLIEFSPLFAEEKKLAPLRSKRLRDTYKSEYASGETSADKDTSLSSYDDGKMKNVFHWQTTSLLMVS